MVYDTNYLRTNWRTGRFFSKKHAKDDDNTMIMPWIVTTMLRKMAVKSLSWHDRDHVSPWSWYDHGKIMPWQPCFSNPGWTRGNFIRMNSISTNWLNWKYILKLSDLLFEANSSESTLFVIFIQNLSSLGTKVRLIKLNSKFMQTGKLERSLRMSLCDISFSKYSTK